jgi:hypothetical protein
MLIRYLEKVNLHYKMNGEPKSNKLNQQLIESKMVDCFGLYVEANSIRKTHLYRLV